MNEIEKRRLLTNCCEKGHGIAFNLKRYEWLSEEFVRRCGKPFTTLRFFGWLVEHYPIELEEAMHKYYLIDLADKYFGPSGPSA